MRLLIICEDYTYEQHIVKPIIKAMMTELNKSYAKIRVYQDTRLGGVGQALNLKQIEAIVEKYKGETDLFLLIVDRDGETGREEQLKRIERSVAKSHKTKLLAVNAYQEIEVWLLAGLPNFKWQRDIRDKRDPKELHYEPYAQEKGLFDTESQGRKELSRDIKYKRIRQRCLEVKLLENRITSWLEESA